METLKTLLDRTDRFAVETVKAGQGGPFGASIHIYNPKGGLLEPIGQLAANAVLSKGMGSAHAENEVISPENVAQLRRRLAAYDPETVQVILSSSGQSCPACTAKEEILARSLVAEGLIAQGNFIVTYGATFKDTFNVASFNDEPYQIDMQKEAGTGMVRRDIEEIRYLPAPLQKLFAQASAPVAAVVRGNQILGIGYDTRNQSGDLMATAEVSAIRAACVAAKEEGKETPWDLGGSEGGEASLFTSTYKIGPMAYAECQWANITTFFTVNHPRDDEFATREAEGISNSHFFRVVGTPDEFPSEIITTIPIPDFANLAQHAWAERLRAAEDPSKILYNGIKDKAAPEPT